MPEGPRSGPLLRKRDRHDGRSSGNVSSEACLAEMRGRITNASASVSESPERESPSPSSPSSSSRRSSGPPRATGPDDLRSLEADGRSPRMLARTRGGSAGSSSSTSGSSSTLTGRGGPGGMSGVGTTRRSRSERGGTSGAGAPFPLRLGGGGVGLGGGAGVALEATWLASRRTERRGPVASRPDERRESTVPSVPKRGPAGRDASNREPLPRRGSGGSGSASAAGGGSGAGGGEGGRVCVRSTAPPLPPRGGSGFTVSDPAVFLRRGGGTRVGPAPSSAAVASGPGAATFAARLRRGAAGVAPVAPFVTVRRPARLAVAPGGPFTGAEFVAPLARADRLVRLAGARRVAGAGVGDAVAPSAGVDRPVLLAAGRRVAGAAWVGAVGRLAARRARVPGAVPALSAVAPSGVTGAVVAAVVARAAESAPERAGRRARAGAVALPVDPSVVAPDEAPTAVPGVRLVEGRPAPPALVALPLADARDADVVFAARGVGARRAGAARVDDARPLPARAAPAAGRLAAGRRAVDRRGRAAIASGTASATGSARTSAARRPRAAST